MIDRRSSRLALTFVLVVCGATAQWEQLPDGSTGRAIEIQAADGIGIAAYIRRPAGPGPFPVVVMLHGGGSSKEATYALGRSLNTPTKDFIAAGWAVFALDFRPNPRRMLDPREWDDTIAAIRRVRSAPFIDATRVALLGGSHGANVSARLASRVDASCAVLCAPAGLDLIEVARLIEQGQEVAAGLKKLIAELESKHGVKISEIAKKPEAFGYSSAFTEAAAVRFPLLIVNGRNDNASPIPVIEAYTARLRAAGKTVETYVPENGPHGFYFGRPPIPETNEAARRAVAFIRKHFAAPGSSGRFAGYAQAHPPRESVGLVPLTDLGAGTYQGESGGLYPGGANTPPPAHLKAGTGIARTIAPIDGKVVLLSIGMSNTTQEFQVFQKLAAADNELDPRLVIVDGAQGGQTAAVTAKPEARYWTVVDERLNAAGVTARQVQIVWLKQANAGPTRPFPAEAKKLEADIVGTLHNMSDRFPNLKIAYLSSRIYAGYAASPLNPEPHAYETAFAVKWVIARQIAGDAELNYDPARGKVRSPWLAWGPYLWADGVKGRKDGLVWLREDVGPDGTHPATAGREKVARLLLEFLKTDPTARGWTRRATPAAQAPK